MGSVCLAVDGRLGGEGIGIMREFSILVYWNGEDELGVLVGSKDGAPWFDGIFIMLENFLILVGLVST